MKPLINSIILSLVFATNALAQNEKNNPVQNAIESKHYVFKARTVMPATGGTRQLTSAYDLTVSEDSVIAFLPYFGRAYSATPGQVNQGINFTSTDFTYSVKQGKKGWLDDRDKTERRWRRSAIESQPLQKRIRNFACQQPEQAIYFIHGKGRSNYKVKLLQQFEYQHFGTVYLNTITNA